MKIINAGVTAPKGFKCAGLRGVKELGETEIKRSKNIAMADLTVKTYAPAGAGYLASMGLVRAAGQQKTPRDERKIIQEYRKEHSDSKLSDTQILNNYYKY